MNKERWSYIKKLAPAAPRFIHISQYFNPVQVRSESGVVTTTFQPAFVDATGRARGRTYKKPRVEFAGIVEPEPAVL